MADLLRAVLVLVASLCMSAADTAKLSCPVGSFVDNESDACQSCCPTDFFSPSPCAQLSAWLSDASSRVHLDASAGSELWNFTTGGAVKHAPTVSADGSRVYLTSDDLYLYAIEAATGLKNWSQQLPASASSPPAVSPDSLKVYVASGNQVQAFDTVTGAGLWSFVLTTQTFAQLLLDPQGRILHLSTDDGSVLALDASNGVRIASAATEYHTAGAPRMAISVDGSILFVVGQDSTLLALKASTGSILWKFDQGTAYASSPAVSADGRQVLIGVGDDGVYALNAQTGSLMWRANDQSASFCLAASAGGRLLYVGTSIGSLYALNLGNGSKAWRSFLGTSPIVSLAVAGDDSLLFAGTTNDEVLALMVHNGTTVWRFLSAATTHDTVNLALDPSGSKLLASHGLSVFALETRFRMLDWYLNAFAQTSCRSLHMKQAWTFELTSDYPPTINNDGKVAYLCSGFYVLALNTETGKLIRAYRLDSEILARPALSPDGQLMFLKVGSSSSEEASISAIDTATGSQLWSQPLQSPWLSPPYVSNDGRSVYLLSDGNTNLRAWDALNGNLSWSGQFQFVSSASLEQSGDQLFITSATKLFAFNASSHSLSWMVEPDRQALSPPCVSIESQLVLVGSAQGSLQAFTQTAGSPVWSLQTGKSNCLALAKNPEQGIFYAACDKELLALNVSEGSSLWSHTLAARLLTSPVVGPRARSVFVWSLDGSVTGFEASTGVVVWQWSDGKRNSGNMLPVLSPDGWTLYLTYATEATAALKIEPCIVRQVAARSLRYWSSRFGVDLECELVKPSHPFISQPATNSQAPTPSEASSSPSPSATSFPPATPPPLTPDYTASSKSLEVWFHSVLSGLSVAQYQGKVKQAFQASVLSSMGLQQDASTSITSSASTAQTRSWSRRQAAHVNILTTITTSAKNQFKATSMTSASLADKIAHDPTLQSLGVHLVSMGKLSFKLVQKIAVKPSGSSRLTAILIASTVGGSSLLLACLLAGRRRCKRASSSAANRLPPAPYEPSAPSFESVFGHQENPLEEEAGDEENRVMF